MKKLLVFISAIALLALASAGASVAGILPATGGDAPPSRPVISDVDALPVFDQLPSLTKAQSASLESLKSQISDYPTDISAGNVEFNSARPFSIPGENGFIWIAKTSDGAVCEFMPQMEPGTPGGFSSGCSSLEDFNRTGLSTLNFGSHGDFVAVSIQPDGVDPAEVLRTDGSKSTLPQTDGVTVANVSLGQAVESGGVTLATSDLASSMKAPQK